MKAKKNKPKAIQPTGVMCPTCEVKVTPIVKMFHTLICPGCNKIIAGDYYSGGAIK